MMTIDKSPDRDYVEELRATGFHGREPWVATLDQSAGTAIATLRQMEICAEQMASVCLDAEPNEDDLVTWQLIRTNFVPRFARLTNRLNGSIHALAIRLESSPGSTDDSFLIAWHAMKSLGLRLSIDDTQSVDCAEIVLPLLFAVISLQTAAHRAANPSGNGDVSGATHLAPAFLQRCRQRLGWSFPNVTVSGPLDQLTGPVGALPSSG
jgi:hypothetical protein